MIMKTLVGRCLKCGFKRDVPTSLKTRVFVCPQCGKEGAISFNNLFVAWLKTFLVNGFWGVIFIGGSIAGVYYYPRVIGHYMGEGPDSEEVAPNQTVKGSQK